MAKYRRSAQGLFLSPSYFLSFLRAIWNANSIPLASSLPPQSIDHHPLQSKSVCLPFCQVVARPSKQLLILTKQNKKIPLNFIFKSYLILLIKKMIKYSLCVTFRGGARAPDGAPLSHTPQKAKLLFTTFERFCGTYIYI